ncbi:MAG: hypothetical protein H6609_17845 [Ignavibacteriales bacterium]|nr:hypothetical protein [Ignavibacteriales bacterium]
MFEFKGSDFIFILIAYPIWKGYIISPDINYTLEVIPKINLKNQFVLIPERELKKDQKNKVDNSAIDFHELFNESELEQLSKFFKLIPKDVSEIVVKYSDSHWEFIKAIIYFGEKLKKLIKVNPSIAYITVNLDIFNPSYSIYNDNIYFIDKILLSKQKKILELAFFPSTEQIVNILSKIDLTFINIENLKQIRDFLKAEIKNKNKILKLLSHQKLITGIYFDLIFRNYHLLDLMTFKAINEIVASDEYDDKVEVLIKIKRYTKHTKPQLPLVKSLKSIDTVLNTVKKAELKRREEEDKFPLPPISGNEFIFPILTKRDLNYWSKRQINCIHNYSKSIKSNENYFYKVIFENEEATLQLILRNGTVRIGSLLATRNKQVSNSLREMVRNWEKGNI